MIRFSKLDPELFWDDWMTPYAHWVQVGNRQAEAVISFAKNCIQGVIFWQEDGETKGTFILMNGEEVHFDSRVEFADDPVIEDNVVHVDFGTWLPDGTK